MRKLLLVAGLAAAALTPSLVFAQSCEQQQDSQVATTLAGIGALMGATGMRQDDGQLSPSDEGRLQARLDMLGASLRTSLKGAGF
ncbi:MAG: hypothetical protein WDM85_15245 [Caulobacteraceae bacterium]